MLPSLPLTVIFSCPFSRELSFSYLTGDGNFSTTTLSLVATFTTVSVDSTTTGFPTFSTTSPVLSFTVYVVVVVLLPSFPLIVIFSCPFSRELSFSYLTGDDNFSTDTLSLAATFTTVSVGFTTTGFPTFSTTLPVLSFTVYVVVVVLLPSFPLTVIFSCPFSRELSFSYLTGDGSLSTFVVCLVPTFTILSIFSFITLE